MNSYVDLKTFKSYFQLDAFNDTYDEALLEKIIDGSRDFDRDTARFFYSWEGTRYFPVGNYWGAARAFIEDLQSFTYVGVDIDGSGNYVSLDLTSSQPDAFLLDWEQKTNKLPYCYLEANRYGSRPSWGPNMRRGIKITGVFGYGDDYPSPAYTGLGNTVQDNPMTNSQTTVTLDNNNYASPGQNWRIDSEQVFVSAFNTGTKVATIIRGINGTVAASHLQGTTIYIYRFPKAVAHAVEIYAAREWRRRQSAYANRIENIMLGTIEVFKDTDPSWLSAVRKYRRIHSGMAY